MLPSPDSQLSIEYVAKGISDYLTSETGITIFFESAIVPKWKDSRISFKNVYVTRRPSTVPKLRPDPSAAHEFARGYDVSNHPANHALVEDEDELLPILETDEDLNYSMFDLTIDSIDVTLSLARWLEGKGLVTDAVVKGVRGVLGSHIGDNIPMALAYSLACRQTLCSLGSRSSIGSSCVSAASSTR